MHGVQPMPTNAPRASERMERAAGRAGASIPIRKRSRTGPKTPVVRMPSATTAMPATWRISGILNSGPPTMPIDVPRMTKTAVKPPMNRSACGTIDVRVTTASPPSPLGDGRIAEKGEVDRQQGEHARRHERDQARDERQADADFGHRSKAAGGTPGSTTIGAAMIQSDRTV